MALKSMKELCSLPCLFFSCTSELKALPEGLRLMRRRPDGGVDLIEDQLQVGKQHGGARRRRRHFLRFTSTMPKATPVSASSSCSVSDSCSSSTPKTSANNGVRKVNDEMRVAG